MIKKDHSMYMNFNDDGRGLDIVSIAEIAKIRGIFKPEVHTSEDSIADLIFESGFTTTEAVSEISGRGVGMDAVRKYLESIDGYIKIKLDPNDDRTEEGYRKFHFETMISIPFFIENRPLTIVQAS
ncbi:hypothetical protein [Pseudobacteriovorax antillogorgiicola]|uniref:Histidine kinase-, DNA gyrase B-, and HSP90-like ATPase n=1 Tax=Pseudobacteriovorax antillogorgiicola TaxID=1513793 RepID=A0A1Y6BKS1_9BACT|nr:hypothetical protein [Pseudobacteriovorax antillogorgiicola]TCS56224.1 histidine kinase/DNA gyrase B/HSP90-like ATPase [Pseudobacteriovorax antillogorgiicola]SMF08341.1 Histidine kinase-, DNA gyrase B-, and HSP90-like ATPase [Pseudobacteriovorax antillogorgiicola]